MAEPKPFVNCGKLFDYKNAFEHDSHSEVLFDKAMNETMQWHLKRCADFRLFMREQGFTDPTGLKPEDYPPLLVTIFKQFSLTSVTKKQVKLELTSSGTGGRKSAIILDNRSYKRILKIVDSVFTSLGMAYPDKVNYICFTYDPKVAGNVGTAFSDKTLTRITGKRAVYYCIKWSESAKDFVFDLESTVKKFIQFSKRPEPIRILGFPAYLWQVCNELEQKNIKLDFDKNSFIITGGGWKMHKDQEVTKEYFKQRVESVLGIPSKNIRDIFGMVEHGIPYADCEYGKLHVPVFARVQTVDPETLFPLKEGQEGLLKLMTPYLSSYPSVSLLTTDKAIVESKCECNRPGKTFRITGRAGLQKHKGCAITALDLLK